LADWINYQIQPISATKWRVDWHVSKRFLEVAKQKESKWNTAN
jgi:hypothetical protein